MQITTISKMILRMWKNRYVALVKRFPLAGLLPIIFPIVLYIAFNQLYNYFKVQVSDLLGFENGDIVFEFIGNIGVFSFFAMLCSTLILWQWGIRETINHPILEHLPVRKGKWMIGQMFLILVIMWIIFNVMFLPFVYVFLNEYNLSLVNKSLITVLFSLLILIAITWSFIWQQMIDILSKLLASRTNASFQRILHSSLLLLSMVMSFGLLSAIYVYDLSKDWIPGFLFSRILVDIVDLNSQGIMLSLYLVLMFIGSVVLSYLFIYIDSFVSLDEVASYVPLRRLRFGKVKFWTITKSEIKRIVRNEETLLNVSLSLLLLWGMGWIIILNDWRMYFTIYLDSLFYGLPVVLSVVSLQSRGADQNINDFIRTMPINAFQYVLGKIVVYLTVLPLFSYLIYTLILISIDSYQYSMETMISFYLYQIMLYLVAYTVGTFFPKQNGGQLSQMLLFFLFSLPVILGFQYIQDFSFMYWIIAFVICSLYFFLVKNEKREGLS
ncbi:hypothetical protein LC087_02075 [Bacillus carboniphilus]|uniref:ABC transporter permease n=1 Tax=Bacillus carboniphilus TaxID=86663 RepID=A0ABY9JUH0_9BACI|nr:hypothetical protein [Bacillus carboniphilus]WLR43030.1 hypothetical protein LC087_02075 [Bacillus carboniphilus]